MHLFPRVTDSCRRRSSPVAFSANWCLGIPQQKPIWQRSCPSSAIGAILLLLSFQVLQLHNAELERKEDRDQNLQIFTLRERLQLNSQHLLLGSTYLVQEKTLLLMVWWTILTSLHLLTIELQMRMFLRHLIQHLVQHLVQHVQCRV